MTNTKQFRIIRLHQTMVKGRHNQFKGFLNTNPVHVPKYLITKPDGSKVWESDRAEERVLAKKMWHDYDLKLVKYKKQGFKPFGEMWGNINLKR